MKRIEFEGELQRVAAAGMYVGGPGRLFEIRGDLLSSVDLPHTDSVPMAVDGVGRLILARTSGDRLVRRYSGGTLDATYSFTLDEIFSLAVSGDDLVVAFHSGLVQRIDDGTVPRIDYSRRLGRRANRIDALGDRIAMAGKETILFDREGVVVEKGPASERVRIRREGYWLVREGLHSGERSILPEDLGLKVVQDVVCGGETEWALGEVLVRLDPS